MPLERSVDTDKNTVTFKTAYFPGFLLGLAVTAGKWAVITGIGVGTVKVWENAGPIAYRALVRDPLYWGNASKFITPDDPVVKRYAALARIKPLGVGEQTYDLKDLLANPGAMNAIAGKESAVKFFDGDKELKLVYQQFDEANDWQMPGDYFSMGRRGDCKNVANAMASVYRSMGFTAMAVDGYQAGVRHGWVEFVVDGKIYYSGTAGEVMPLERAVQKMQLVRPAGKSGEGFMWDENGQQSYNSGWWLSQLKVTVDEKKAYPGGWATIQVIAAAAQGKYMQVTVERPDGTYHKDKGLTDAKGIWEVILPIGNDDPAGYYTVTAVNPETQAAGKAVFKVVPWDIKVLVKDRVYYPGDTLTVEVRLSPPRKANLHFTEFNETRTTGVNGYIAAKFVIPGDAEPGSNTVTVTDTENNLTGSGEYAIDFSAFMAVNITPDTIAPGGSITVNILIDPPVSTKIMIEGFSGTWTTGADGIARPQLTIAENTRPGTYELVVMAPEKGILGFDDFTVIAAPSSTPTFKPTVTPTATGVGVTYNVAKVGMHLWVQAAESGRFDSGVRGIGYPAGYMRIQQSGNRFTGTKDGKYVNEPGTYNIDIWLNETARTMSGSCWFDGDAGTYISFDFSGLPEEETFVWELNNSDYDYATYGFYGNRALKYLVKFTGTWPPGPYDVTLADVVPDDDDDDDIFLYIYLADVPGEDVDYFLYRNK